MDGGKALMVTGDDGALGEFQGAGIAGEGPRCPAMDVAGELVQQQNERNESPVGMSPVIQFSDQGLRPAREIWSSANRSSP